MIIKTKRQGVTSRIKVTSGNGYGSTNTRIRRYTTTEVSTGADVTYADSATLGATFTIVRGGTYSITTVDMNSAANSFLGVSLNSSELTTGINTIAAAARLTITSASANIQMACGWDGRLYAGDIVRAHSDGTCNSTVSASSVFEITRTGD